TAPSPSGMVGRFLKPQIRAQHEWPGFVTANDHIRRPPGLALVDEPMAQLHGTQRSSEATSFSISPAPAGTSEASKLKWPSCSWLISANQRPRRSHPREFLSGSKQGSSGGSVQALKKVDMLAQ